MIKRRGDWSEFLKFWTLLPEVKKISFSLSTPAWRQTAGILN
jgi:hypothetical protein